jgi:hypothetical protein
MTRGGTRCIQLRVANGAIAGINFAAAQGWHDGRNVGSDGLDLGALAARLGGWRGGLVQWRHYWPRLGTDVGPEEGTLAHGALWGPKSSGMKPLLAF